MRRFAVLLLVFALVGGLAACQTVSPPTAEKPKPQGTPSTSSNPATPASPATPSTPAATANEWANDLPVWFGSYWTEVALGSRTPPSPGTGWRETVWKYYEGTAAIPEIRNMYRDQMKTKGWTQVSWTDPDVGTHISYWQKNNSADGAMLWVITQGRGVFVATARSRK